MEGWRLSRRQVRRDGILLTSIACVAPQDLACEVSSDVASGMVPAGGMAGGKVSFFLDTNIAKTRVQSWRKVAAAGYAPPFFRHGRVKVSLRLITLANFTLKNVCSLLGRKMTWGYPVVTSALMCVRAVLCVRLISARFLLSPRIVPPGLPPYFFVPLSSTRTLSSFFKRRGKQCGGLKHR